MKNKDLAATAIRLNTMTMRFESVSSALKYTELSLEGEFGRMSMQYEGFRSTTADYLRSLNREFGRKGWTCYVILRNHGVDIVFTGSKDEVLGQLQRWTDVRGMYMIGRVPGSSLFEVERKEWEDML